MRKQAQIIKALVDKHSIAEPSQIKAREKACSKLAEGLLFLNFEVEGIEYEATLSERELTVNEVNDLCEEKSLAWDCNDYGRGYVWQEI